MMVKKQVFSSTTLKHMGFDRSINEIMTSLVFYFILKFGANSKMILSHPIWLYIINKSQINFFLFSLFSNLYKILKSIISHKNKL